LTARTARTAAATANLRGVGFILRPSALVRRLSTALRSGRTVGWRAVGFSSVGHPGGARHRIGGYVIAAAGWRRRSRYEPPAATATATATPATSSTLPAPSSLNAPASRTTASPAPTTDPRAHSASPRPRTPPPTTPPSPAAAS